MADIKTKLCIIKDPYPLPIRGKINGPVLKPSEFTIDELRQLLVGHFDVWEVDPHNKKNKIKLSFGNLGKDNFAPVKREKIVPTPGIFEKKDEEEVMGTKRPSVFQNRNDAKDIQDLDVLSSPDFF